MPLIFLVVLYDFYIDPVTTYFHKCLTLPRAQPESFTWLLFHFVADSVRRRQVFGAKYVAIFPINKLLN